MAQPSFSGFPLPKPDKKNQVGKRTKNGTTTSSSTTLNFFSNNLESTNARQFITVSGLPFTPRTVVYHQTGLAVPLYFLSLDGTVPAANGYYPIAVSSTTDALRSPAVLTSDGFTVPFVGASVSVDWFAFE